MAHSKLHRLASAPMTEFDFDRPIDRRNTASTKWDRYRGRDILPLWLADMDFACAPPILDALHARVAHGIFGYTEPSDTLNSVVCRALEEEHGWRIDPDWLRWLPGLVCGINLVCQAVGSPGDAVITATPVYHPFMSGPRHQGRELLRVPLLQDGTRWAWDLDALASLVTPRTRLLMLCNPHNPVGRVFTREELEPIGRFAQAHDLIVCSDEIHCGLVLEPGLRHVPLATLGDDIAARSITLMAASKTFNLPGLGCAFAVVPDAGLRQLLERAAAGIVPRVPTLGFTATAAAYGHGLPWRHALIDYLRGNRDQVTARLGELEGVGVSPVEATYLAWIDLRDRGLADPMRFFEDAGVGLFDGATFGAPGFLRLNFACPRATLDAALSRMARALARG